MPEPMGGDGAGGLSPDEAFGLLANETRMAILRELWEADSPLPFSTLRDRIGAQDSGNFNYHLGQLAGHFVSSTGAGYVLREAGETVMRAVISGAITSDPTYEPERVDEECPYCGAQAVFSYQDEQLTVRCSECPGVVDGDRFPPGTFMSYAFPPAGLADRTAEEVIKAAHTYYDAKIVPMMAGVCPECAGQTAVEIDICDDHRATLDSLCPECDSRYKVWSEYYCTGCDYRRRSALWFKLMNHSTVIAFFHEFGDLDEFIPLRKLTAENARFITDITETVVSDDPLRIRVDIPFEGHTLQVTVDEALNVVGVDGPL